MKTSERRFEYTPDPLPPLNRDEIFVFGSNTEGVHGAGAARVALEAYGAIMGKPRGLQGRSYAIVTKDLSLGMRSMDLERISEQIFELYNHAKHNPELTYYVTKIGCGLGGYKVMDIARLFHKNERYRPNNVVIPQEFAIKTAT